MFANDPLRTQTANIARIRAFNKVGKECSFECDFTDIFGKIDRSEEAIERAIILLSSEDDRNFYYSLWIHRIALFKLYLKDIVADDVDYDLLAQKTDGYVSKDVCSLINNAACETAKADLEFISMQILLDTIEKYKNQFPSVSKDVLKQHERLREEFENHIGRKPIGFTQQ